MPISFNTWRSTIGNDFPEILAPVKVQRKTELDQSLIFTSVISGSTYHKICCISKGIEKRFGYWKADDLNKFAFPASEIVFNGLLSHDQQEEWLCIAQMEEFLHHFMGGQKMMPKLSSKWHFT